MRLPDFRWILWVASAVYVQWWLCNVRFIRLSWMQMIVVGIPDVFFLIIIIILRATVVMIILPGEGLFLIPLSLIL